MLGSSCCWTSRWDSNPHMLSWAHPQHDGLYVGKSVPFSPPSHPRKLRTTSVWLYSIFPLYYELHINISYHSKEEEKKKKPTYNLLALHGSECRKPSSKDPIRVFGSSTRSIFAIKSWLSQ